MDSALFSDRSVWTMIHGIVLGGGALMALAAALFSLRVMRIAESSTVAPPQSQAPITSVDRSKRTRRIERR